MRLIIYLKCEIKLIQGAISSLYNTSHCGWFTSQYVALWMVHLTICCTVDGSHHSMLHCGWFTSNMLHCGWFTSQYVALWMVHLTICCTVGGSLTLCCIAGGSTYNTLHCQWLTREQVFCFNVLQHIHCLLNILEPGAGFMKCLYHMKELIQMFDKDYVTFY